jgi:hypothetical protein
MLIAVCVVTAAFVSVFALAHQCLRIVDDMKNELRAAQTAESEMERLRAMPWSRLIGLERSFALDPVKTPGLAELIDGAGAVRISPLPGATDTDGLRAVSVRIAWVSRDGRKKELALATLMAPRGEERP